MAIATNEASLQAAVQSAQGTPATNPQFAYELVEGKLLVRPEIDTLNVMDRGIWVPSHQRIGAVRTESAPVVTANPVSLGMLLLGVLGEYSVTGSADPYVHEFTPTDDITAFPWFTFWQYFGGTWERFADCTIPNLTIACDVGNRFMRVTPTIMSTDTPQVAAEPTLVDVESMLAHWLDAEGNWTLDGSAIGNVRGLELVIGTNAAEVQGESITPYAIQRKRGAITVNLRLILTDLDLVNEMKYGSSTPTAGTEIIDYLLTGSFNVKFTMQDSPERSVEIDIPSFAKDPTSAFEVVGNPEGNEIELVVTGEARDNGVDPLCTITLTNDHAEYASVGS